MKTETLETTGESGGLQARLGWFHRSREFFQEVRNELKRVTWPTRPEVYATTVVVILTAAFFGLYLFGVDLLLSAAVTQIFTRFGA